MTLKVKQLMQKDLVKVHADSTIEELDRLLSEHDVSGVPVVDENANLVGIVSQSDIVRLISQEMGKHPEGERPGSFYDMPRGYLPAGDHLADDLRHRKVSEIMERRVHTLWPDDDVARAAAMMRRLKIHRLLVLDEGRVAGILTTFDLIRILEDVKFFEEYYGGVMAQKTKSS